MTPIEKVISQVDDPWVRLAGAKILSLLTDIVGRGLPTTDNMEQLQLFSDMVNLDRSARGMVDEFREMQYGIGSTQ